jgi:hypothetical protein
VVVRRLARSNATRLPSAVTRWHEPTCSVKSSWRDTIIDGNINIEGSEISLSKDLRVDDRTAVWLKAAYDWHTGKSLFGSAAPPPSHKPASSHCHRQTPNG